MEKYSYVQEYMSFISSQDGFKDVFIKAVANGLQTFDVKTN